MDLFHSLILGAVQGITEFLPISSDGHLVLAEKFLGLKMEGLKSFDVLLHMGTFLAILVYFRKDVWQIIKTFFLLIARKVSTKDPYVRLIFYIVIGTIPAVLLGFFGGDYMDSTFRNIKWTGIFMIIMAAVFIFAEAGSRTHKDKKSDLNWKNVVVIGIAQAFALLPGISRSGSTISAAIFQGIDRAYAARFSFLLGLPAMFGAGLLTSTKTYLETGKIIENVEFLPALLGFLSSFSFGLLSIFFLMKFLKKHSLIVFAIYLLVVGGTVLFLN